MVKVIVRIPAPLRSFTSGADDVPLEGESAREVLHNLGEVHPGILEKLLDESGELRGFVNVYIGEQNIRSLSGLQSSVTNGDILSIVPAVAGGAR